MMQPPDFHVVTVFSSKDCIGNATSLVVSEDAIDPLSAQRLASIMSSDLGFLYPDSRDRAKWCLQSCSPVETLVFCVQTLLASGKVLYDFYSAGSRSAFYLPSVSRTVIVEREDRDDDTASYWTAFSAEGVVIAPFEMLPNQLAAVLRSRLSEWSCSFRK